MPVELRPMTADEFAEYEAASIPRYAEEMVRAGFWSPATALERSKETHTRLLPDGVNTVDHLLFSVCTPSAPAPIGVVWISIDRKRIPPSGFIFDLRILKAFRGRGFGKQAMLAVEDRARALGLTSLELHVFEDNGPAKALYTSLGYVTRSLNMTKRLPGGGE